MLTFETIRQSWQCKPLDCSYWYKVSYHEHSGFTVYRRKALKEGEVNYMFWEDRQREVDAWVSAEGGMFYTSYACRPIMKLQSLEAAENIILEDAKKHPQV